MNRTLEAIAAEPWLITEAGLRQIALIAERGNIPDIDALARYEAKRLEGTNRVRMRDGTAIVPVLGPIFRYANLFTEMSGATSTQVLATDFQAAVDDPNVQEIVLNIDSPGGAANGIHELARAVYESRGAKPIAAYSGGTIASAAYWIGSAADSITIDRTTMAGSIGAVMSIIDSRVRDEKSGVRQVDIVSSQSPHKRMDHTQDEGRAKLQQIVDDLAAVFVDSVALHRDASIDTVLADFGQGGLLTGQKAVDAGLVDRLGSLESVITQLQSAREPQRRSYFFMSQKPASQAPNKGPVIVRNQGEYLTALQAGTDPATIQFEAVDTDAIKTAAHAEGMEAQKKLNETAISAARQDAITSERNRIVGLRQIAMKGFEKEIDAAITAGDSVADTAVKLATMGASRGTTIASQAADAPQALRHGGAGASTAAPLDGEKKGWGGIVSKLNAKVKRSA